MQGGVFRSALAISINALTSLLISRPPQPKRNFAEGCDSLWRIGRVALKVGSHGAVYIHHRRRGFFARKRSRFGGARRPAAGTWLQGSAAQARPLSQSRSRNDVTVPARRSVRDRRWRPDR